MTEREYNSGLNTIQDYIKSKEIVNTENETSFYYMYKAVKAYYEPLYNAFNDIKLKKALWERWMEMFPELIEFSNYQDESIDNCCKILPDYNGCDCITIKLGGKYAFTLKREKGSEVFSWSGYYTMNGNGRDHYPCDPKKIYYLMDGLENDILNIFKLLEYYENKKHLVKRTETVLMTFSYSSMDGYLSVHSMGYVNYTINIRYIDGDLAACFSDHRPTLASIIRNNEQAFLGSISIDVSHLKPFFKSIYIESFTDVIPFKDESNKVFMK